MSENRKRHQDSLGRGRRLARDIERRAVIVGLVCGGDDCGARDISLTYLQRRPFPLLAGDLRGYDMVMPRS